MIDVNEFKSLSLHLFRSLITLFFRVFVWTLSLSEKDQPEGAEKNVQGHGVGSKTWPWCLDSSNELPAKWKATYTEGTGWARKQTQTSALSLLQVLDVHTKFTSSQPAAHQILFSLFAPERKSKGNEDAHWSKAAKQWCRDYIRKRYQKHLDTQSICFDPKTIIYNLFWNQLPCFPLLSFATCPFWTLSEVFPSGCIQGDFLGRQRRKKKKTVDTNGQTLLRPSVQRKIHLIQRLVENI